MFTPIGGGQKASNKTYVGLQVLTMGIGVSSLPLTIPPNATALMVACGGGESSQVLQLTMSVTGATQTSAFNLAENNGSAIVPSPVVPIPRDTLITGYSVRRLTTTVLIDYVVFYYTD